VTDKMERMWKRSWSILQRRLCSEIFLGGLCNAT